MEDRLFQELLDATREALAHRTGEKRDLRTTALPELPEPMSRADVRRLRDQVKVSQAVFARCLNVSTKLVQAWEGGTRNPDGAALRLMRVAERAPALVFAPPMSVTPSRPTHTRVVRYGKLVRRRRGVKV